MSKSRCAAEKARELNQTSWTTDQEVGDSSSPGRATEVRVVRKYRGGPKIQVPAFETGLSATTGDIRGDWSRGQRVLRKGDFPVSP